MCVRGFFFRFRTQVNTILQTRNEEWEERLAAKNAEFLENSARAEGAVQTARCIQCFVLLFRSVSICLGLVWVGLIWFDLV